MIIKLTYQDKCACSRSSFCTYVENEESFTSSEKEYLVKVIVNDNLSGVLYVSTVLVVWSLVVGIIDVILFPGIIVYAVFHGVIDYKVLTPPIVFMIVNFSSKLIYIGSVLKGRVSLIDIFVAALPYAGSAYLLKKFLVNDKLLSQAMVLYLKEKKKQVKKFFLDRFRLLK